MPQRLNFSDSWHRLQKLQLQPAGPVPRPRDEPPRWDDPAPSGLRFHQQLLADLKLSHLSLPFTFISRSEFKQCTFRGSDLSGSVCHWNDFIQVDFTKTDLRGADFRACLFEKVKFCDADLTGADLRYCGFKQCNFSDADLTDARLTRKVGASLGLTTEQMSLVDWQSEEGEEPPGG